jgi:hypothetical protein
MSEKWDLRNRKFWVCDVQQSFFGGIFFTFEVEVWLDGDRERFEEGNLGALSCMGLHLMGRMGRMGRMG